jgi:hypothetical protein
LGRFDEILEGKRIFRNAITEESIEEGELLTVPPWGAWVLELQ